MPSYPTEETEKQPSKRKRLIYPGQLKRASRRMFRLRQVLTAASKDGHWYTPKMLAMTVRTTSDHLFRLAQQLDGRMLKLAPRTRRAKKQETAAKTEKLTLPQT
jgi:hypothetical protein